MDEKNEAIAAIRKKLVGKNLDYKEIYSIMDQIARGKLGDILTTYFAASGFSKGFSDEELYFLTKAMVETGEKLHFTGIVADKHSIGGAPGTRTTLIVVPIVAAAGFTIPKSSSRAITTPAGTAEDMEILAPVKLSKEKIYDVVEKTNGCIVWGGSFNMAPADDEIIKVEEQLLFESYDKIIVSIIAKKIAFGSNHVVIDLPYGPTAKVHRLTDAEVLSEKFEKLAKRFGIKIKVIVHRISEPEGRGVGPMLETKDALLVLEQSPTRPIDLEEKSLFIASSLLEICIEDSSAEAKEFFKQNYSNTKQWATEILKSGYALQKMKDIIKAQGGYSNVKSSDLKPGKHHFEVKSEKKGKVASYNLKNLTVVTKILGAPNVKGAGIYLNKKSGENVEMGDTICTLYGEKVYNLTEGVDSLNNMELFKIQ